MIKRTIIFCFFIWGAFYCNITLISAQELKIGVFDIQRILRESKTINNYRQELLKNMEVKRKPLFDKEGFVKALDDKLKKNDNTLSSGDRRVIEERLANEVKELRRMKEDIDIETRKMDQGVVQKSVRDIDGITKKIADAEDYTIIFERNAAGIVHFKSTIDITDRILEQLK
ncbi:MAG: hypothetical protein C0392_09360 [Syntrophus sp. (in: bacteria)]|nr:hypothetical protein [Syntrophus sp. (in: bacteria)]